MNVRELRKQRNLTQAELAEITGLTQPTISRVERGYDGTTLEIFKIIAKALNVPLGSLFLEPNCGPFQLEDELIQIFRQLSSERQQGGGEMARFAVKDQKK